MSERNEITHEDIWNFVQEHKNKTKKQFGGWLLGQTFNPSGSIIKALLEYNEKFTEGQPNFCSVGR
jgi:hypothetical protein